MSRFRLLTGSLEAVQLQVQSLQVRSDEFIVQTNLLTSMTLECVSYSTEGDIYICSSKMFVFAGNSSTLS